MDLLIIVLVTAIIAFAAGYIRRAKRRGVKCIGCPDGAKCSGCCAGCKGACGGCGEKGKN